MNTLSCTMAGDGLAGARARTSGAVARSIAVFGLAAVVAAAVLVAAAAAASAATLREVTGFGSNPGNLRMFTYVPDNLAAGAPLVVALHGCTQTAASYDDEPGWTGLADRWGFALVLPEQKPVNNSNRCFNWFEPGDITRGQGEALSIAQMVDAMRSTYGIDASRVFVTGLSAGGAMTAVMLAAYPDVFAGGAVVAGIPYKCAQSLVEAFTCMSPGRNLSPSQWGSLVRSATSHTGPWPIVSIWHGDADTTVVPMNARESMEQWTNVHGIDQAADTRDTVAGYPHEVHRDATGRAVVETYVVTGMGHGAPIDPGPGERQCGIAAAYILDVDICSSYYIGTFWGLDGGSGGGGAGAAVATFGSRAAEDGYVKANADGSGATVGSFTSLAIGRGTDGKLNRTLLSFGTAAIPDGATVTRAFVTLQRSSGSGDPWADPSGNRLVVDVKTGCFGACSAEAADWSAAPTAAAVAEIPRFTSGSQRSSDFGAAGLAAIDKTGMTQLKLRFVLNQTFTSYVFVKEGSAATLTVEYEEAGSLAASVFEAPAGAGADPAPPPFVRGEILEAAYDGVTNDLLTGGLGAGGLLAGSPLPPFADPARPTAAELRTHAIATNYRALVDTSPAGGYGVLYGPNVTAGGVVTDGEGLVAGEELLAYADDGSGRKNVTMMVQVPAGFDPARPCIVAAPSSGSRGVYGAIGTAGEWGLAHGCAVAYTDKGGGTGAHDLEGDTVNLIDGVREDAGTAGKRSNFTASLGDARRAAYAAESPNRFAFKHAHSQQNPEQDWGRDVLRAIEFAFFVLDRRFGGITPERTIVIASSVSNGGGASLRAAEQDTKGLIDAVVVSEPNVTPRFDGRFVIVQEGRDPVVRHSRPLLDYVTLVDVYQACASLAPENAAAPLNFAPSAARCAALREGGLLASTTLAEQAAEAQRIINDYGILPEQNIVQPSHWLLYVPQAVALTYANAYGRFGVDGRVCGMSFGATDAAGRPAALPAEALARIFGTSSGIPPTGGVGVVNDLAPGGPLADPISTPDQNLDGALCLRALATGLDPLTGAPLTGLARARHGRIAAGIERILASGDLHGIPAIVVTGRSDAILPPNHTSRAYVGLNRLVEGEGSRLRYYEVTNAQHLDALNAVPGFDSRFVPLHRYFVQAMDLMLDHLTARTPLPPSQVVRTIPRGAEGGIVPPITPANVPPISLSPDPDALITFAAGELRVPGP